MGHGPALWIISAIDQAADPGMADRAGAHGAGLQGHDQGEVSQPIVSQRQAGRAKRQNFGVGRRVMGPDGTVTSSGDYLPCLGIQDHGAHRNLALDRRLPCGIQGQGHGGFI